MSATETDPLPDPNLAKRIGLALLGLVLVALLVLLSFGMFQWGRASVERDVSERDRDISVCRSLAFTKLVAQPESDALRALGFVVVDGATLEEVDAYREAIGNIDPEGYTELLDLARDDPDAFLKTPICQE